MAAKLGAESYILSLFTRAIIFAIAALSLDLIMGYGALASFGHAAFIGIGSYAVGIMAANAAGGGLFAGVLFPTERWKRVATPKPLQP